ncbi:MAG: hypothetical protein ABII90_03865 [Bacteroidota bacterium]
MTQTNQDENSGNEVILYKRYDLAITRPGGSSVDELLTIGMLRVVGLLDDNSKIERRDPSYEELDDYSILVVDNGGRYEPEKSNFDHAGLDHVESSLSLMSRHLVISGQLVYDMIKDEKWFHELAVLSHQGLEAFIEQFGMGPEILSVFANYMLSIESDQEEILHAELWEQLFLSIITDDDATDEEQVKEQAQTETEMPPADDQDHVVMMLQETGDFEYKAYPIDPEPYDGLLAIPAVNERKQVFIKDYSREGIRLYTPRNIKNNTTWKARNYCKFCLPSMNNRKQKKL